MQITSSATSRQAPQAHDVFVDLVDFKWLMAGVGWWVNLSRLQRDNAYADECLQRAMNSGSKLLHERGAGLLARRMAATAQGHAHQPGMHTALAA